LHTGDGLSALAMGVKDHPEAFFWFDNVLGQLRFTDKNLPGVERQLRQIHHRMRSVAWGSVHDRMSGPCVDGSTLPLGLSSKAPLPMEAPLAQAWLHQMGAISPWLDHLTENVLPPGTPLQHTAWPFKPGYAHWLEMGWCPKVL
jgi:hypothetical protein